MIKDELQDKIPPKLVFSDNDLVMLWLGNNDIQINDDTQLAEVFTK